MTQPAALRLPRQPDDIDALLEQPDRLPNTSPIEATAPPQELEDAADVLLDTPLPVVNTTHPRIRSGELTTAQVRDRVYARGRTWISEVMLTGKERTIRACITSYHTTPEDIRALVRELEASLHEG